VARDLDLPVEIVGAPTRRDADGLALSSRNAYLSAQERAAALALPRALQIAATTIDNGGNVEQALEQAKASLVAAGFSVDYFELVDGTTLEPVWGPGDRARLLAAARIGQTRLIDNVPIRPAE
jgi:pantoate--beta-alanine ligase